MTLQYLLFLTGLLKQRTGSKALSTISGASASVVAGSDNKAFLIKLPKGTIPTTEDVTVTLQNAIDANNNEISPTNFTVNFSNGAIKTAERNVDISTGSAKVTDARTIEVSVNALLGSLTASEFVVTADGATVSVSSVETVNDYEKGTSKIKLTLAADADVAKTYVVGTHSTVSNSKDIYGSKLQVSKAVVAPYSVSDLVEKAFVTGTKEVTAVLKNATSAGAINAVAGDFVVKNAAGTEIAVDSVGTTTVNGKAAITLTTASNVSESQTYTVVVKDNALTTVSGNKLAKGEVATSASEATKVEFTKGKNAAAYDGAEALATDRETITLTFAESINVSEGAKTLTTNDTNNTITLPGVGVIKFNAEVIGTNNGSIAASYAIKDNNKLVVTLGALTTTSVVNQPGAVATFTPNVSLLTVDGRPSTVTVTPQALVSDLIAAQSISATPNTTLNNAFKVAGNFTTNIADNGAGVAINTDADMTSGTDVIAAGVNGLKLTATHSAGVVTIGVAALLTHLLLLLQKELSSMFK